jgi:hypothetical protein
MFSPSKAKKTSASKPSSTDAQSLERWLQQDEKLQKMDEWD